MPSGEDAFRRRPCPRLETRFIELGQTEFPQLSDFYWQLGYGAFSVSPSHVDVLMTYIANQMEHHRTESFQEEFRRLCRKYGVALDERYVWDGFRRLENPRWGSRLDCAVNPGCAPLGRDPGLRWKTPSELKTMVHPPPADSRPRSF
jgi:hypothetical protein